MSFTLSKRLQSRTAPHDVYNHTVSLNEKRQYNLGYV